MTFGTVKVGTVTFGTVTVGTVTFGTVTVGVVTVGVETVGVLTGVDTVGTVSDGTVSEGTVWALLRCSCPRDATRASATPTRAPEHARYGSSPSRTDAVQRRDCSPTRPPSRVRNRSPPTPCHGARIRTHSSLIRNGHAAALVPARREAKIASRQ